MNRFATATTISKRDNDNIGIKISRHTISRRLNEINLNSRVASTKPYISKKNKMSRLKFASEHVMWTEEQWDCAPFSDESKFNLFGCNEIMFVRRCLKERCSPQCTKSSVQFEGGSVMVFGMISIAGTGTFVRLHGKINATVYKEKLKKHMVPNFRNVINQPAIFMQDNVPCQTARSVKTFLFEEDVFVMEWPAQSPDMNPIENVWKLLNERTKEKNPRSVEGLWTNLKEE